jgi:hypothetical protein
MADEVYVGACHCGTFRVALQTSCPAAELALHQCTCTFCRKHGATTVTDRDGRLQIHIVDVGEAVRYRFGPRTADFLVCGRCGVYVAAVLATEAGTVSTLNVNVLDARDAFVQTPAPVDYDDETPQQRRRRRAERWTLTTIVVGDA